MNTHQSQLQGSIEVNAQVRYLAEQSNPDTSEFTFAYTINIANNGEETVQLLARHWIITDGNNSVREIEGEGVVGDQPHISPGETYQYSSGAILATKIGTMEGSYKMLSESGEHFDAIIQPFGLVHPGSLQ